MIYVFVYMWGENGSLIIWYSLDKQLSIREGETDTLTGDIAVAKVHRLTKYLEFFHLSVKINSILYRVINVSGRVE